MGEVIPRLAHFIWVAGGPAMPAEYERNIEGFKQLNPDVEVRVWDRPPADMPEPLWQAYWGSPRLVHKADILRLWLLHEYGGIYSDLDVWWRRPADDLFEMDAWCVSSRHTSRLNTVMGAPAGHPYLKAALQEVLYLYEMADTQNLRRAEYGPVLMWRLAQFGHSLRVLPTWWFFPVHTGGGRKLWKAADAAQREVYIEDIKHRYRDGQSPHGVHLAGMSRKRTPVRGDELLRRLPRGRSVRVAEVGVYKGQMSAYLLACREDLHLIMVDPWAKPSPEYVAQNGWVGKALEKDPDGVYAQAMAATKVWQDRCTVLRQRSVEAAALVADGSLDAAYIDDNHQTDAAIESALAWAPKLQVGGLLCGHDYYLHEKYPECRVCDAVAEIARQLNEVWQVAWDGSWFIRVRSGLDENPIGTRGKEFNTDVRSRRW